MAEAARRQATYQDVLDAPEHLVAEIIDGELHLNPRPAKPHSAATSALGDELGPPFKRGKGGPGGWIISMNRSSTLLRTCSYPISPVGAGSGCPT